MNKTKFVRTSCIIATIFLFVACNFESEYTPKPSTYYRISFPEKEYNLYDTTALPFTFEVPTYANIVHKRNDKDIKWFDIIYPSMNGTVFISYKQLNNKRTLAQEVDTAHQMMSVHFNMSSGIQESNYADFENKIFADSYTLKGNTIASTYQFWATDSVNHFVRGAFYINGNPNYDSLEPVYKFIQQDIIHFIETLRWK